MRQCVGSSHKLVGPGTGKWALTPCDRPPEVHCHVCARPICTTHGRIGSNGRGYKVRACPDCRAKLKSTDPRMQP